MSNITAVVASGNCKIDWNSDSSKFESVKPTQHFEGEGEVAKKYTSSGPSRQKSMELAKERALKYLRKGDKRNAVTSLISDFKKFNAYPEEDSMASTMLLMGLMNPDMVDESFITGFE